MTRRCQGTDCTNHRSLMFQKIIKWSFFLLYCKKSSVRESYRNPELPRTALRGWMSDMESSSFTGSGGGTSKGKKTQSWKVIKVSGAL